MKPGGSFVVCDDRASADSIVKCNLLTSDFNYNGDDAIGLVRAAGHLFEKHWFNTCGH